MSIDAAFDDADLNAFVDGRIDPSRAAALAESIASDPDASARLAGWRRQNESLRTMFASVLFEPVPVRLLPAPGPTRGASAAVSAPESPSRTGGRTAGVMAITAVGMGLIGFAAGALASLSTDGFGLMPTPLRASLDARADDGGLAVRAAEIHRTFIGDTLRPVEVTAAEEPRLLRWIQHRLGPSLRIPDLGRQGWTLVGGRIVPGRDGPAAFLVYGNGGDRLGLTVSRTPNAASSVQGAGRLAPGLGVATWGDEDFGYALTADRGPEWLSRNAMPLRDSVQAQIRVESP